MSSCCGLVSRIVSIVSSCLGLGGLSVEHGVGFWMEMRTDDEQTGMSIVP